MQNNYEMTKGELLIILSEMKDNERSFNIFQHQKEIRPNMRVVLIEYLTKICAHRHFNKLTLFLTIDYLDRYMCVEGIKKEQFQLVGLSCLLIATKIEEVYPIRVVQLVKYADNMYTPKDFVLQERTILKALEFRLNIPTIATWIDLYIQLAKEKTMIATNTISEMVTMCHGLLFAESTLPYSYRTIASAIFYNFFPNKQFVTSITQLSWDEISPCAIDIHFGQQETTSIN